MNQVKKKKTLSDLISISITLLLDKLHGKKLLPGKLPLFVENFFSLLRGKEVRFSYCTKQKLYCALEERNIRYFENLRRGFWLYRNGILSRGDFIFGSYCLENIDFNEGDIVIDCGANSGDLFIELQKYINAEDYYAIEPNPSDFKLLQLNVKSKKLFNIALGESNGKKNFWISTEGGDSSLIRPENYVKTIDVSVARLDSFIEEFGITRVKLLKLEAEGYEPEILKGLEGKLENCEYIAIDGGYERGESNEQTFTEISNFLILNNYKMIDIYFPWCRALFKNRNSF